MGNTFKTALLLTAMTLLLLFLGQAFGGERGMMTALVFAVVMNFTSYFFSDKSRWRPIARNP
jgi:heat shock protein HtpX